MSGRRKVVINYRSQNGADPKSIMRTALREAGGESDVEINIDDKATPHVSSDTSLETPQVMDEPRETEIVARTNEELQQRRDARRAAGRGVDERRQAPADERLAKRSRLRGFSKWAADAIGKSTVGVVFITIREWAKGTLGL
ncbi:MAG: hypothetical protein AAFR76_03135 [Planctomycetota bacterium]